MRHTPFYLLVVSVAVAGSPRVAHGQRASFLQSLASPPQSVGSCSAAPPPMQLRADAPVREFAGRQLELTVEGGRARRTMMVYSDRRGRPRQYAEMTGPGVG